MAKPFLKWAGGKTQLIDVKKASSIKENLLKVTNALKNVESQSSYYQNTIKHVLGEVMLCLFHRNELRV